MKKGQLFELVKQHFGIGSLDTSEDTNLIPLASVCKKISKMYKFKETANAQLLVDLIYHCFFIDVTLSYKFFDFLAMIGKQSLLYLNFSQSEELQEMKQKWTYLEGQGLIVLSGLFLLFFTDSMNMGSRRDQSILVDFIVERLKEDNEEFLEEVFDKLD